MKINFKLKFLITIILFTLLTVTIMPLVTSAMSNEYMRPDQFDNSYTQWADKDIHGGFSIGKFLKNGLGSILSIVRIIALAWAVVMAVSIAIKYMTGGPIAKGQLKTDLPTYLIGAIILFGATGVLTLVQYLVNDVF